MDENTEGLAPEDQVEEELFELHPEVGAVLEEDEENEEVSELLLVEKLYELLSWKKNRIFINIENHNHNRANEI